MKPIRLYRNALAKLVTLGPRGWVLLVRAKLALVAAKRDVSRRPQGELVGQGKTAPNVTAPLDRRADAERVAIAVRQVAAYSLLQPTCLVRSLAISKLLIASGIEGGQIRVGVALRGDRFVAHAWVEYGGAVIGDDEDVARRFATFDDLRVVAGD